MDGRTRGQILALANPFKEGDLTVGGTRDDRLRQNAKHKLLALTVRTSDGRFSWTTA